MSIITDGYGRGSQIVAWGYGLLEEIIEIAKKIKILLTMAKKNITFFISDVYKMGFEVKPEIRKEVEFMGRSINIDLQQLNKDIVIELTKVEKKQQ